jgi:thiol-disulfide isomerase/thioredoxin
MTDSDFNKKVAYMELPDFDEKMGKFKVNEKLVIMCMSSWCHACKTTKPAFAMIADELKTHKIRAACIMFDGDKDEQILGKLVAKEYGVKAFPTFLRVDASGNVIDPKNKLPVGGDTNPKELLKRLKF